MVHCSLLAEVYIDLIGTRQAQLIMASRPGSRGERTGGTPRRQRETALARRIIDADREAHWAFVASLGDKPIWNDFLGAAWR